MAFTWADCRKRVLVLVLSLVLSVTGICSQALAKAFLKSFVISDKITAIHQNGSIDTKNNGTFFPRNNASNLSIKKHTIVSIRYYEKDGQKIYVEIASGKNALTTTEPTPYRLTNFK